MSLVMLHIGQTALEAIVEHARADAPDECCGLLVGKGTRIERAVTARNLRRSPTHYLVDPEDHFAAIRAARADGLEVVGAYHSHPATAARPSPRDVAEAHSPGYVYVIVSLAGAEPDVRAFELADGQARELPIMTDQRS
jgi:proteasome lid subunit RPN8/RPN11